MFKVWIRNSCWRFTNIYRNSHHSLTPPIFEKDLPTHLQVLQNEIDLCTGYKLFDRPCEKQRSLNRRRPSLQYGPHKPYLVLIKD